jgi:hypothetical protein
MICVGVLAGNLVEWVVLASAPGGFRERLRAHCFGGINRQSLRTLEFWSLPVAKTFGGLNDVFFEGGSSDCS